MKIFGLDFTSAPSHRKPITCAVCTFQSNVLQVEDCLNLLSFEDFETFLRSDGPWLAALDFPFGQPRKLITNLGWPETWEGYIEVVSSLGKIGFEQMLTHYCASRPLGDKHHQRVTDVYAGARSPMMLHRVPVGKMFFQGATRLLTSNVSILPCRPTDDDRRVVEGYPALVARRWLGNRSYKSDELNKQNAGKHVARQLILNGLRSEALLNFYGFSIELSDALTEMLARDPTGDSLDALLCAVQAAWAYGHRENGYGIPPDCDEIEGWIVDPTLNRLH